MGVSGASSPTSSRPCQGRRRDESLARERGEESGISTGGSRQDNWTVFAQDQTGEIRMTTPKSANSPQRKGRDTSQAGCRGFASRLPSPSSAMS
jgi:hypothetical protein